MMKKKLLVSSLAIALSLGLTACAPNISPDVVSASSANRAQTAVEGVIISKRVVTVKGDDNTIGTLAGAVIGAVAGSTVGGGNMRYVTGAAGAVGGGAAGNVIQDKLTTQQGIEYSVLLTPEDTGGTTTVSTSGQGSGSATLSEQGSATLNNKKANLGASGKASGTNHYQQTNTTTVSHIAAKKTIVTIVQGQGSQPLPVGQKVLVTGVGTKHMNIISM